MTPGTGKFFLANNYHVHLFNDSYEFMNIKNDNTTHTSNLACSDVDSDALREMFDKMQADRDLWKEVAENLASELGKKEYAHAEYDTCKEVAEGVAW
jgi:hypothetical protein